MSRIAFVIGDGVSGGKPLAGVAVDHRSYRAFLESDGGGAWRRDEIIPIGTISSDDLDEALTQGAAFDYALVVFTGHGFLGREDGLTYCCINDEESVPEVSLATGAPKQLTVIDGCRKLTSLLPFRRKGRTVLGEAVGPEAARQYRASCRLTYDRLIRDADVGVGTVYACSEDTGAGDSPFGGLFSTTLLEKATAWVDANRDSGVQVKKWLSVGNAFVGTARAMKGQRFPQRPAQALGLHGKTFPFAVA